MSPTSRPECPLAISRRLHTEDPLMSLRIFTAIHAGLFFSASCLLLAGCGAEAAPVSLQNSQFSPAGAASDDSAAPSRIATEQRISTDVSAAADPAAASSRAANSI